ncbi:MAG: ribonuclease R [Alistipes sp.]|nr:ribonuclease R [Alistipes sp.]
MTKKKKINKTAPNTTGRKGRNTDRAAVITELFRLFPTKRYTIKALASASGGADREGRALTGEIVRGLVEKGTVQALGSAKYRLSPSAQETMEGIVDMLASGSAYIKVEGQEKDIFVDARNAGHALNGDRVKFIINRVKRNGVPEGEIVEILSRSERGYVGVIEVDQAKGYGFVRVDSRKVPVDIFVRLKTNQKVRDNEKVMVRILDWPDASKSPEGEIVGIFGQSGDNNAEMHAILAEYDLPYDFAPEVIEEAENIPGKIEKKDYIERRDMRNIPTFTIDPADAKDFDDALSIRKLVNGSWEVGVHIADVTHYVRPGSIVDTEGENRATSVYLVDRTIPMLPERLSNELCSLRPNEEKLTFSAIFELDDDANILQQWLGRTVILSDRRFTYEEAQQVIETGQGDFNQEILTLHKLARTMRERRFRDGSISFEREEAKFKLDENGKPVGVYFKEQKESNQLIEEFMLLANRKVAEFVGKKRGRGANAERTFVYRVHDEPNPDKLATFRSFITRFGYSFRAEDGKSVAREMNRLMGKIKGKSEENVVSTLAIRTMAKAYYSTDNIGHYGLAFDYYTHFTSPIRRYPDMMVHRLLARYLAGEKSADKQTYEKLCEHSSEMEVRAAEAERASIKYKMVEFMTDRIGQEFDGAISGVTEWGMYVELEETHIEGMVPLREMTDDFYIFQEEEYAVVGRATHRKFTLGDKVRIRVERADLARRQIDFSMVASYDFKSGKAQPIVDNTDQKNPHPRSGNGYGKKKKK